MKTKSTSVRLPEDTLTMLDETASRYQISRTWIINRALEQFFQREEYRAQRLRKTDQAYAQFEAGQVTDSDDVLAWIESWSTENEAPPVAHET